MVEVTADSWFCDVAVAATFPIVWDALKVIQLWEKRIELEVSDEHG